jgi:hypothetical protein
MQESIAKRIAENPDHFIQIRDDVSAQSLLLEIGVIDKFAVVPRPHGFTGGYANAVGYPDHSTHWIIGFLYSGYEKEVDNGYCALAYPKKRFTSEQVMAKVREELSKGGSIHDEKMVDNQPKKN